MSFTCPDCGSVSYHPEDFEHGYCGACHAYTGSRVVLLGSSIKDPGENRAFATDQTLIHLVRWGDPRSQCCGMDRTQVREYLGTRDPTKATCPGTDRFGRARSLT